MRAWLWLGLALVAVGSPSQAAKCRFSYSDQVRDTVVRPALAHRLGANWRDWDTSPTIRREVSTISLIFWNSRTDLLDPSNVMLVLEHCGAQVTEAYFAKPFPGMPWQPLPPRLNATP